MVTSWDVLGGDVTPQGDVLFYDDNGTHSAMSAAEMIARSGAALEIVTPERMLAHRGGWHEPRAVRAGRSTRWDVRITLNQRVMRIRPEHGRLCVEVGSDHTAHRDVRHVDWVVTDHGTAASADLYFELKPASSNLGAVDYGALMEGRPQHLVAQRRRCVPAVPHRRRRRQPEHPRRRLRRVASREGPLARLERRLLQSAAGAGRILGNQPTEMRRSPMMDLVIEVDNEPGSAGARRCGHQRRWREHLGRDLYGSLIDR